MKKVLWFGVFVIAAATVPALVKAAFAGDVRKNEEVVVTTTLETVR